MHYKKATASLAVIFASALVLVGCSSTNTPQPEPSGVPTTSKTSAPKAKVKIEQTDQFLNTQDKYGQFAANGKLALNIKSPNLILPSYYTADQYIQDSFNNAYLFSGQWAEDGYTLDWANDTKLYTLLQKDYSNKFAETIGKAAKSKNPADVENLAYTIDPSYTTVNCEAADKTLDNCAFPEYQVTDASFDYKDKKNVSVDIKVQVSPIYQKPDSSEGNEITQTRLYDLKFDLTYANPPASKDTKTPIMLITNISSSLDIQGTQDYSVNSVQQ